MDLGQIDTKDTKERSAHIKRWCAHLLCLCARTGQQTGIKEAQERFEGFNPDPTGQGLGEQIASVEITLKF